MCVLSLSSVVMLQCMPQLHPLLGADGLQLLCLNSNCYDMPMHQLLLSSQPGSSHSVDLAGVPPRVDLLASYELIEVRPLACHVCVSSCPRTFQSVRP